MTDNTGKTRRIKPSFSLGQAHYDLLKQIVAKTRRPMAEEMRIMIEDRAAALGMPVDPKSFALAEGQR